MEFRGSQEKSHIEDIGLPQNKNRKSFAIFPILFVINSYHNHMSLAHFIFIAVGHTVHNKKTFIIGLTSLFSASNT